MRTLVGGVHLLNIVAHGLEHLCLVVPNLVWTPLPSVDMGEERSRSCHMYDVGITLKACHVSSLQDSSLVVVPLLTLAVTGILTRKHLWSLAIVRVVAEAMAQEPCFITIIVLVVEVHLQFLHAGL